MGQKLNSQVKDHRKLRIALVHDYLRWHGGAERVLEVLHEMWPEAPVYTSIYNPESMPKEYESWDIRTSFMQRLPAVAKFLKHYSFLYPLAFEQFDFSEYDVVISSSAGFAKGIITKPATLHLAYTHTPPRFQWGYETATRSKLSSFYRDVILPPIDNYLRIWDQCAAKRVDHFISNSQEVQKRIKKFYRRDSTIINPPVSIGEFASAHVEKGDYFVTVSRLERYKRIEVLIAACNRLGLKLKIIGEGSDRKYLESLAGPTVQFMGRLDDNEMIKCLAGAKAFLFMTEEDFGIAMVEAQASGIPVIAYGKGGATEIIQDGKTGILLKTREVDELTSILEKFDLSDFNSEDCCRNAERFSKEKFKQKIQRLVEEFWSRNIYID